MARPAIATLTPIVEGDTWDGIAASFSSDGTAFDSALSSVEMDFRTAAGVVTQTLTSAAAEITIDDANAWEISVPEIVLSLTDGVWHWSITTTDAGGIIKTRIAGTIQILPEEYSPTT
jgi:hypothetical protein